MWRKHQTPQKTQDFPRCGKIEKTGSKPRYIQTTNLLNETGDPECWEVSSKKKFVDDDKPVHFSLAILQYSKLMFLE